MNINGRNLQKLTDNNSDDWSPVWSPDGTQIAFSTDRDGNNPFNPTTTIEYYLPGSAKCSFEDLQYTWERSKIPSK